jgi:2-aminophenol/2-amino-5-chlorophenol 1,6-dioxygenase beta subunit
MKKKTVAKNVAKKLTAKKLTLKNSAAAKPYKKGEIVMGCLAPHPPHLVYAENPPQNEPRAECGWENLRWAYERLRTNLAKTDYDVLIVHSPHWRTQLGTHLVGVPNLKSLSVDPIFPNLFRYHYDIDFDVKLSELIHKEIKESGLETEIMRNKDYRVDYGTIVSGHMLDPEWKKPIVSMSSEGSAQYYNLHVMQSRLLEIGKATRRAIEKSGLKVVLVASHSLSHRHFTVESALPEDMSKEHIHHHGQYIWDMKLIEMMKKGQSKELIDVLPDFTEQTNGETDSGGLIWLMSAMNFPTKPALVHGYGTVIGTGNAVVEFSV